MDETAKIAELQQRIKELELQLKKTKEYTGYGLKREDKPEIFEEIAQNALPVLKENKELFIDNKSDLDHIIIEGDNYHALSALNYTHKGMIDVIYIDPPYNTGNKDFIYNDNYVDPEDSYRHSKWLSFMSKRLRLAKNLLSNEGVIFISIDDNEQANLKLLCDDIFLPNNFVATIIRQKKFSPQNDATYFSNMHDFILCYAKKKKNDKKDIGRERILLKRNDMPKGYSNPDKDPKGPRSSGDFTAEGPTANCIYEVVAPNGKVHLPPKGKRRVYNYENYLQLRNENRFRFGKDGNAFPRIKRYWAEVQQGMVPNTIWTFDDVGHTQEGKQELNKIFNQAVFDYPKPTKLLKRIIEIAMKDKGVVLDFFAGSGTTGQAVLELNKQDGGHRQFILCSNSEATKENPDKNICKDITYERNKRVMQGYTNSKGEKVDGLGGGNLRYYTTKFIKNKKSTDDLRQSFIYLCDELLCIKEDTFNEVKSEFCSNKLKCYQKNDHYTAILYDVREMDKLKELLGSIEGQISVYLFSLSGDSCEEELQEFADKIAIENIPDDILETYKKIF